MLINTRCETTEPYRTGVKSVNVAPSATRKALFLLDHDTEKGI